MIKGLLFDADGTLIDTYDIILESMRATVNERFGYDIADDDLMQGVGTPLLDQMMRFCADETKAEEMVAAYRAHNDAIHDDRVHAFPGTRAALDLFATHGYKMGVVTSKRHELAVLGLEICGLADCFEFVIGSDDWPEHKPSPGPVVHGCDLLDLSPKECLYIGDSPYDIQAGSAAGCTTVAALWGMFSTDELMRESPDIACESLHVLAKVIA